MLSKSIKGPAVLCLSLFAVGIAGGAPSTLLSSLTMSAASFAGAAEAVERSVSDLDRYRPLAAADLVTNSIDGAAATVALRGSIGDGSVLRYSIVEAPKHGAVRLDEGRATYTPDPGFEGVDTYVYRVHSGEASVDAVVAVTAIGGAAVTRAVAAL